MKKLKDQRTKLREFQEKYKEVNNLKYTYFLTIKTIFFYVKFKSLKKLKGILNKMAKSCMKNIKPIIMRLDPFKRRIN